MATKTARPKSRPSRRTRHSKDDSDIYAALNDFTDGKSTLPLSRKPPFLMIAVEAMPSELVRQFTLLREVDAKYSGTSKSHYSNFETFKRKSPPKSIPF